MLILTNINIIKQIQHHYDYIDTNLLMNYIRDLIKQEFLRYNNNETYFNQNFEDILLNKRKSSTKLDYAIEQAIFITLQPLRTDINSENIEQVLLSWSGYILNRDVNSGEYPKKYCSLF